MKVNTNEIGGEITKDNETYVLEDNNLLEHITLSKTTLKPNQSTRGHLHDDLEEVYFFTKGEGKMVLGEEEFDVKAADIVLIPQGKFHRVINDKNESIEFVCVFENEYTNLSSAVSIIVISSSKAVFLENNNSIEEI